VGVGLDEVVEVDEVEELLLWLEWSESESDSPNRLRSISCSCWIGIGIADEHQ
jgi:hypothetical protein